MSTLPKSPAYPVHPEINPDGYASGLTVRELFAARAMQGLLSSGTRISPKFLADDAIRHADALILALNKTTS
jgi:hypothetical protein